MKLRLGALEIALLRLLCTHGSISIGEAARQLKKSQNRISTVVKELENKGLVKTESRGISKHMTLSSNKHAQSFRALINQYGHMNFEHLISDSTLKILLVLSYSQTAKLKDLSRLSGCSEITAARITKKLKGVGIVYVDGKFRYSFGKFHSRLLEFVVDFQNFINLKLSLEFSDTSAIMWQRGEEFLVNAQEEKAPGSFLPTAYEEMAAYGVQLIIGTNERHYFYSPGRKKLRIEDVALHSLVYERGTNTRTLIYVLFMAAKNPGLFDWRYMEKEGAKFGLSEVAQNLRKYLECKGSYKPMYFPTWREFAEKAEQYDICLK